MAKLLKREGGMEFFYKNKQRIKSSNMLTATDLPFSKKWNQVLKFHLPNGGKILDPTCGEKLIWKEYQKDSQRRFIIDEPPDYEIIFSDTGNLGGNIVSKFQDLDFTDEFDAIVFDPPYIFGAGKVEDLRDYGGYTHSFGDIKQLVIDANRVFPSMLKEEGLLFFKCSDVFSLKEKKLYPCGSIWIYILDNFELKDIHHHISGTAWQVKDRPCSIINYTYLFVFERRK